ncbi:MAG TPA: RHS repeat-associated core domain-containing protein [Oligoflexus sp.]|uniref:RHS repeat domain-containing protein n=1 Tax=Oligoflexus sp. TaxID=1971216 RepID=UPI002D56E621|nr:RHS repeat-associated core domain-containing protein [Oligoflexus sp.]HYX35758.1 RHS repeat-associated core domain-containing protein [Oligoflexus sp.]
MGRMIRQKKSWAGATEGPTSIVTEYSYDAIGRLLTTREGVGTPIERTVTHAYDAVGNQTSIVDARGNTTSFAYDALNRMVASIDANGKTARKSYDASANEAVMIDRLGRVSKKTYDALNRILSETDALDQTTTRTYDGVGNMLTETDRRGAATTLTYDALNRVLTRTKPMTSGGPAIMISRQEYEIEATGRVEATVDGDNHRVVRVYDQDEQVTEERYADGSKKRYTFDAGGRLVDSFDESNFKTTRAWFADGRIKSITNANNEATQFTHDIHGEESGTTTPLGGKTLKIRDELKRLIAIKQPDGAAQEFTYDGNDNLASMLGPIQDPSKPGNEQVRALFRYTYNKLNKRTKIEQVYDDATAFVTTFAYDDELNLIRKTDAKGQQTSFTYDALNREKSRTYAGVTGQFYRGVSETRNYNPNGDLTEVRETKLNPSGSSFTDVTTMDYDLWGRMISKTERGKAIGFQYDNRSNRTRVGTGNGTSIYTFDAKSRLESVSTDGQTTGYDYHPNGRVKTETHPNGTQNAYTYDPAGQTLSIITKKGTETLVSFTYEYDRNGNRSKQIEFQKGLVGQENLTTTYTHDSQDRLTGYTEGNKTITYTYDGAHNRLTEKVEVGGAVTENWAYAYDRHNRLLEKRSMVTNAAEINQYDANGNRIRLTKPGVTQEFHFDSRDGMSLSKEGNTLLGMYDYNFDGMRVRHEGSDRGDVTSYGINVVEETIGSDALRYSYGLDTAPISIKSAGGFEYYHQATLGTASALTDAGGSIKASYRTSPWGDIYEQSGSTQNRMIFTSQEHDPNTGLLYFGARYYESGMGRFVSKDPWFMEAPEKCLERPVECNLWGYVANRPLINIDYLGLEFVIYETETKTVTIYTDSGGKIESWDAVSGPWGNGVLPEGTYTIDTDGIREKTKEDQAGAFCDPAGNCYFIPIEPLFKTDRNALGIHPDGGQYLGTQGCIGLKAENTKEFLEKMKKHKPDLLQVIKKDAASFLKPREEIVKTPELKKIKASNVLRPKKDKRSSIGKFIENLFL